MERWNGSLEVGVSFNKIEIIGDCDRNKFGDRVWMIRCECGTEQAVPQCKVRYKFSCGRCCRPPRKHGKCSSPEYGVWCTMRKRCTNPNDRAFDRYGGRGISVCERWDRFENFLADMGRRPSPKHSLDRIDNDGDYEPGNCRWATVAEQMRNRRDNVWMSYGGATLILADWARLTGLPEKVLQGRKRLGWCDERALTAPLKPDRRRVAQIDFRHPDHFVEDVEDALRRPVSARAVV